MAQISIRVDDDVKRKAEQIFNDLGLSMAAGINVYLKAVVREYGIPFELALSDPFYSDENMLALNESIQQMKNGKTVTKTFEELEKMTYEQ